MTSIYVKEESLVQQASAAYTANKFATIASAICHFSIHYNRVKNYINKYISRINQQLTNLLLSIVKVEGLLIWL